MLDRLAVLAVALLLPLSFGCGFFGGGGSDEIPLMEFDSPPPAPAPGGEVLEAEPLAPLLPGFDPAVLVEVGFLYGYQVRSETLQRINRDLQALLDYGSHNEVDLEWVIDVHEVTEEADFFFERMTGMEVPGSQREQYEYLYLGMLETIQVMAFGSDRVLAAALLVGPGGRSLAIMPQEERDRFLTLIRESRFYLRDAETLVERQLEDVGDAVSQVGFQR